MKNSDLQPIGADLWLLDFPLRLFGMEVGRRVTIVRLSSGDLVIHSTAPFTATQVDAISELGRPRFLLDGTTLHDTFSREGRAGFPDCPYLVPEGFPKKAAGPDARPLQDLEGLTQGELQAIPVNGTRFLREYACYHPASRTLILCDLMLNLVRAKGWTQWAMRHLAGVREWPAIDRPMRLAVRDREAFQESLQQIVQWDFQAVIFGHGERIPTDGERIFRQAMERAGF